MLCTQLICEASQLHLGVYVSATTRGEGQVHFSKVMKLSSMMALAFLVAALCYSPAILFVPYGVCENRASCSILVTGSSSGIGLALVQHFASLGYGKVYAGVRRLHDHPWKDDKLGNIVPVLLDVTNATHVRDVMNLLTKDFSSGMHLYALINNAGIGGNGPFELDDALKETLLVNLLAPMTLARAVLPLLRAAGRGRIVNIGSVQGEIAVPTAVSYSASKFGLRGFSDGLRRELVHLNIHVSCVQPGFIPTRIAEGIVPRMRMLQERIASSYSNDTIGAYREFYQDEYIFKAQLLYNLTHGPVDLVVNGVRRAVESTRPRPVYYMTLSKYLCFIFWFVPNWLVDWVWYLG